MSIASIRALLSEYQTIQLQITKNDGMTWRGQAKLVMITNL